MTYLQKHKLLIFVLSIIVTIETVLLCIRPTKVDAVAHACQCNKTAQVTVVEPEEPSEPTKVEVQCVGTLPAPKPTYVTIDCPLDDDIQKAIFELCEEYDVDFAFTMALIFRESSFRPNADSGSSVGLMQINRINHEWLSEKLGITNFFNPEQNVKAGLYMLSDLFRKYENPRLVLMAYNMGESGAKKLWNKGVYTTDYAENVLRTMDEYTKEIAERMGEHDQM